MEQSTRKKRAPTRETLEKRERYRFKRSGTYRREIAKFKKLFQEKVQQNLSTLTFPGRSQHDLQPTADGTVSPATSDTDDDEPLSDATIASNNNDDTSGGYDSDNIQDSAESVNDDDIDENYYSPDDDVSADDFDLSDFETIDIGSVPEDPKRECQNLRTFIRQWAIEHNIRQKALDSLLGELSLNPKNGLPKVARTLMGTPKTKHIFNEISGGMYWHQGFEFCLRNAFLDLTEPMSINININIDGLAIHKNGRDEFWPILFNIHDMPQMQPMII